MAPGPAASHRTPGGAVLEVMLLGPVEARADGAGVPLTPLERSVLAILALSRGTVVSTERIIDCLWDSRPPVAPRTRVQGLVSALRRKVGGAVVTRHPGYLLDLPGGDDLSRCEEFARRARSARSLAEAAQRLRQAVELWRGEPLDGVAAPGVDADRVRLAELRLGLIEECFAAELGLGRHAELVGDLAAAVAAHPLRERLAGHLMLALYRCDRTADALRVYHALQRRLEEELGSDPGRELRELHAAILRGDRPSSAHRPGEPAARSAPWPSREAPAVLAVPARPPAAPAQLPADPGQVVGRDAELAALTAAAPGRILVVSGAGGLGKTALAVRWGRCVADRFPDGQIFVSLSGLSPGRALAPVLAAFGLTRPPAGLAERAAAYRTLLHDRRVLVLADDAGSVEQLLPLVPPTGGSQLVVTSRYRLDRLVAHHDVTRVDLAPLAPAAARTLLAGIVGGARSVDATEVLALCGGWPLVIRRAGAALSVRPGQSMASYAAELRATESTVDVFAGLWAALAGAYSGLSRKAGRLFGVLGLLPSASAPPPLLAAAAGLPEARVARLLDELVAANLVAADAVGSYACPDLIWRYARRCGQGLGDRAGIEQRIVDWHLGALDRAGTVAGREDQLVAAVRWIAARGDPELTWRAVARAYAAGLRSPAA